jgi:NAD(P)-dependent dehydrogenase (short-subunit alcohol dehydrogenase family)
MDDLCSASRLHTKGGSMGKLDGKVAAITGGNSGVGLATAQRFVEDRAYVCITGRRQGELDRAVKQIGGNVTGVRGDVSDLADLDRLQATVKEKKGAINVLFANAGFGSLAPIESITESGPDCSSALTSVLSMRDKDSG